MTHRKRLLLLLPLAVIDAGIKPDELTAGHLEKFRDQDELIASNWRIHGRGPDGTFTEQQSKSMVKTVKEETEALLGNKKVLGERKKEAEMLRNPPPRSKKEEDDADEAERMTSPHDEELEADEGDDLEAVFDDSGKTFQELVEEIQLNERLDQLGDVAKVLGVPRATLYKDLKKGVASPKVVKALQEYQTAKA